MSQTKMSQRDLILRNDWDLLVILDACRYDTFENVNWIPGSLSKVVSAGSATMEWLRNTFTGSYPDVIYVSSIPYIASRYMPKIHGDYIPSEHFGKILDLWHFAYDYATMTVLPETVGHVALQFRTRRVIAHFIQPHAPMIGDPDFTMRTWKQLTGEETFGAFPPFDVIFECGYGNLLRVAYRENLRKALTEVEKLVGSWDGKVVITADHGEGFGENGVFGHREGLRTPELVEVPWLEVS